MAIGTITPVKGASFTSGNKRLRVYDVQLTSGANYATGGETIAVAPTGSVVGLRSRIDQVNVLHAARNAAGTSAVTVAVNYVSPTTVKLQYYFSVTGAADSEVAANSDLSTFSVRVGFTGA